MIVISFDDYCRQNQRMASLLKEHGLEAIFFVECGTPEKIEQIAALRQMGFSIGGHTLSHPGDLKILSDEQLRHEVEGCEIKLREFMDRRQKWFAYPRGRFNFKTMMAVEAAGFTRARTTRIGYGGPQFEKNGFHCFARKEYNGIDWLEYISQAIENYDEVRGNMHIWGHAWEIDKNNEWEKIENLFKAIAKKNENISRK